MSPVDYLPKKKLELPPETPNYPRKKDPGHEQSESKGNSKRRSRRKDDDMEPLRVQPTASCKSEHRPKPSADMSSRNHQIAVIPQAPHQLNGDKINHIPSEERDVIPDTIDRIFTLLTERGEYLEGLPFLADGRSTTVDLSSGDRRRLALRTECPEHGDMSNLHYLDVNVDQLPPTDPNSKPDTEIRVQLSIRRVTWRGKVSPPQKKAKHDDCA